MTPRAYGYCSDVPLYVHTPCLPPIPDVDALLDYWASVGIRPIRVGARVTLGYALDGAGTARLPEDADARLIERWGPLVAMRLGGPAVACAIERCGQSAAVMLVGGVAVCRPHAEAPSTLTG